MANSATEKLRKRVDESLAKKRIPNVRGALMDELEFIKHTGKSVGLLLSGGIDSNSVLFACLALKIPTVAYSFTFKDAKSRDYRLAKNAAKCLGVEFKSIWLPREPAELAKYMMYAVARGCRSKTDFECFWPMMQGLRRIAQDGHGFALSATAADSHFALSKKASMHFKDRVDIYRTIVFRKRNTGQKILLRAEAARLGITYFTPYDTTRMCSELHGQTWEELNKPKQKNPLRTAFPEYFAKVKIVNHANLQLGDSGIAKHFEILLKHKKWNPDFKYKAVKGVYNEILRQSNITSEDDDDDE